MLEFVVQKRCRGWMDSFAWGKVMVFWKAWWWVGAFCLLCSIIYFQSAKRKKAELAETSLRLSKMENEQRLAAAEKETLLLQIASQADPAWIEMILMRDLGVVPEGYLKVHFTKPS